MNSTAKRKVNRMELTDKGYLRKMLMYEKQFEMPEESYKKAMRLIFEAPTVEAVQVVRCKDCKCCKPVWFHGGHTSFDCEKHGIDVEPDFYCADGARKDGEHDG